MAAPATLQTFDSADSAGTYDDALYKQALAYRGHPPDWRYNLTKTDNGKLVKCDVAVASRAGRAVWTVENGPRAAFPVTKPSNADIAICRNLTLEGEHPPKPRLIHVVARDLRARLERLGLIPPGTAMDNSGAGFHFAIPLAPNNVAEHGGADVVNEAVSAVVRRYIVPEWQELAAQHGLEGAALGSFDISRVMSYPGTFRPGNSKPGEIGYLQSGYLRRWLPPHDTTPPVRVESATLTTLIVLEAAAIRRARARAKTAPPAPPAAVQAPDGEIAAWLADYAASHAGDDRSGRFHGLVQASYLGSGRTPRVPTQT